MPLGISLSKMFFDKSNMSNEIKPLILSDILPEILLLYMVSVERKLKQPMLYGICPVNLFECKFKYANK